MSPKQMDPISSTSQAAVVFQCLGQSSEQWDLQTCIDVAITQSMSSVREDTYQGSSGKREKIFQFIFMVGRKLV